MPPIRRDWRACGPGSSACRARASRSSLWPLVALAVIAFAPGAFWQNDLSKLTPVPADALAHDARLRDELGAPDVRYVIALQGRDADAALQASERLRPALEQLVAAHAIAGYDTRRALPAERRARSVRARRGCPTPRRCGRRSTQPSPRPPFRTDVFADFVARRRNRAPGAAADAAPTSTARRLRRACRGLLLERGDHATALVSLSGLRDPAAVARIAQAHGAQLLDLKQASESLVVEYRQRVLLALAVAALLLVATVWVALRTPRRVLRVLAPMALTTLLILAVLRGFGVELNLFHLVALILAAGLGLDYALFFEHAGDDRAEQLRTLHAVIVCSLTTLLVFACSRLSSIPVLRAIGSTVAIGVFGNFALALLIAREARRSVARRA